MAVLTYKKAGVDIDRANVFIKKIKPLLQRTRRPEVLGRIGGFSGLFLPKLKGIKNPVLVSATDGVGTKLMLADLMNKYDTVGIDLVAMCVDDVVVTGAEPLFFLDYIADFHINSPKPFCFLYILSLFYLIFSVPICHGHPKYINESIFKKKIQWNFQKNPGVED